MTQHKPTQELHDIINLIIEDAQGADQLLIDRMKYVLSMGACVNEIVKGNDAISRLFCLAHPLHSSARLPTHAHMSKILVEATRLLITHGSDPLHRKHALWDADSPKLYSALQLLRGVEEEGVPVRNVLGQSAHQVCCITRGEESICQHLHYFHRAAIGNRDNEGNNSLHLLWASSKIPEADISARTKTTVNLIKAGVALDAINATGVSPIELILQYPKAIKRDAEPGYTSPAAFIGLRTNEALANAESYRLDRKTDMISDQKRTRAPRL